MKFYKPKLLFHYMQGLNLVLLLHLAVFSLSWAEQPVMVFMGQEKKRRKDERKRKKKTAEASVRPKTISYVRAGTEKNLGAQALNLIVAEKTGTLIKPML